MKRNISISLTHGIDNNNLGSQVANILNDMKSRKDITSATYKVRNKDGKFVGFAQIEEAISEKIQ